MERYDDKTGFSERLFWAYARAYGYDKKYDDVGGWEWSPAYGTTYLIFFTKERDRQRFIKKVNETKPGYDGLFLREAEATAISNDEFEKRRHGQFAPDIRSYDEILKDEYMVFPHLMDAEEKPKRKTRSFYLSDREFEAVKRYVAKMRDPSA